MGCRVYAWLEVAPWTDEIADSAAGKELLAAAISAFGWSTDIAETDQRLWPDRETTVLRIEGSEVNYGTDAIERSGVPELASAAGLWCSYGDEGGVEWDASTVVRDPAGNIVWQSTTGADGALLSSRKLAQLKTEHPDPKALVAAIDRHFHLGVMSLGDWIAEANNPQPMPTLPR